MKSIVPEDCDSSLEGLNSLFTPSEEGLFMASLACLWSRGGRERLWGAERSNCPTAETPESL